MQQSHDMSTNGKRHKDMPYRMRVAPYIKCTRVQALGNSLLQCVSNLPLLDTVDESLPPKSSSR